MNSERATVSAIITLAILGVILLGGGLVGCPYYKVDRKSVV